MTDTDANGKKTNLWEKLGSLREHKTEVLRGRHYLGRKPGSPKIVLSVIGDSRNYVPKPWLTSVFKTGLIETAKGAKDCLILYKGSSEKVSSIVREAVVRFEKLQTEADDVFVSLVGLLPMVEKDFGAEYDLHHQEDHKYGKKYWEMSNRVLGDTFHVKMKEDTYPEKHASILKDISTNETLFMDMQSTVLNWFVPVLTIVVEGDLDTIEAVHQVLMQDLPVLILRGTGKAADFIADFIDGNSDKSDAYVKDKTLLMFGIVPHSTRRKDISEKLMEIKDQKCLVTFIDITMQTKPAEFTDVVTKAIIRGWSQWKQEGDFGTTVQIARKNILKQGHEESKVAFQQAISKSFLCEKSNFMKNFKDTVTPASLSLYYYVAFQIVQYMDDTHDPTTEKRQDQSKNFNILLKEAIVADRDEYVSVLLEEDGVRFEEHHFPDIYEETVLLANKKDTDFQHILKWGSSAAIDVLKSSCYMKKICDILDNMKAKDSLQETKKICTKDSLQKAKKEFTKTLNFPENKNNPTEQAKLRESAKRATTCVSKVMEILKTLSYTNEALEWLYNFDKQEFTQSLTELLKILEEYSSSLKKALESFQKIAEEQRTTTNGCEKNHYSYKQINELKEEGEEMFEWACLVVENLEETGFNIFNKSKKEIYTSSSLRCIKACRNICQTLLDYPKSVYMDGLSSHKDKNCCHKEQQKNDIRIRPMTNGEGDIHDTNEETKETEANDDIRIRPMTNGEGDIHDTNEEKRKTKANDEVLTKSDSAFQDLFIWAILVNRPNLAIIFWMKCKNQLLCALLASCLYKRMAKKVKDERDQSFYEKMMEQSRIFEDRALNLQQRLYDDDANLAMDLIITKETVWDITISPLACAHKNDMLDFIAQTCSQRRLNTIWYNGLGASLGGFWKKGFFTGCCCCCRYGVRWSFKSGRCCTCFPVKMTFMLKKFLVSPLTKFLVHYVFFLAAMVCYSAFLLAELETFQGSIKVYEWIVYIFFLADIIEEYRNLVIREFETSEKNEKDLPILRHTWWYHLKKYLYNFWNFFDVVSFSITIVAICIRFFHPAPSSNAIARRVYSLSLFTMYMRFLQFILMSRKLGPKIIMIKEMLKDLLRFLGIYFVFMMGVGVLYHANMYPKHDDLWNPAGWEYWRIWKIMFIPYWQMYGDSFLDTFSENSTTPCTTIQTEWESNPEIERCNQYDWTLGVIAALYMLISNLLLVNLVIALFSYRFEHVQENSEKLWRHLRYEIIMDYTTRIPAPINLIIRPIQLLCFLVGCCIGNCNPQTKCKHDKRLWDRIEELQSVNADNCVNNI